MNTRLEINLNAETTEQVTCYQQKKKVSATETIRRAMALLDLVEGEIGKGGEVYLKSADGKTASQLWLA